MTGGHEIAHNEVRDVKYYGYTLVSNQWMMGGPPYPLIPLDNNHFEYNKAENCGYHGVFAENSRYNTIENNHCDNNGYNGIRLYFGSNNNLVKKNHCNNNGQYGIRVQGNYNTMEENHAKNNGIMDYIDQGIGNVWIKNK